MDNYLAQVAKELKTSDKPKSEWLVKSPKKGQLCLAAFVEEGTEISWYRASISQVFPSSHKVEVHLIDHGSTETLRFGALRELKSVCKEFYDLPSQAIKCRVKGLPPPGEDWTPLALERLEKLVVGPVISVKSVSLDEDVPEIELYVWTLTEMNLVSQILLGENVFGEKSQAFRKEYVCQESGAGVA